MKRFFLAGLSGLLVAGAYMLWQTDLAGQVRYRLAIAGLVSPGSNEGVNGRGAYLDRFAAIDADVRTGSIMLIGDSIVREAPFSGACLVNRGIGGERSDQLLANMRRWPSLDRASAVIISIGTNDVFQERQDGLGARMADIIDQIDAPTYVIALSATLPGIGQANRELRAACTGRCRFIEYRVVHLYDGIHLARDSYEDLARKLPLACPEERDRSS